MKKILVTFLMIFMIIGCNDSLNTPKNKVSNFLDKYKNLDDIVLQELEYQIESNNYTDIEKKMYRDNIKRQYQSLQYKIIEEKIFDNNAVVNVEIEVYDYAKAIEIASKYFLKNQNAFINEHEMVDKTKYIDYKLEQMSIMNERVKYNIEFNFYKKNKIWHLNKPDDIVFSKINGLYSY